MGNIDDLRARDVARDIANVLDGRSDEAYFDNGASVSYSVERWNGESANLQVVAESNDGSRLIFNVSVSEAKG